MPENKADIETDGFKNLEPYQKEVFAQGLANKNIDRFLNAGKYHVLRIVDDLQTTNPEKIEAEIRRRDDLLDDLYTSDSFTHEFATNLEKYLPLFDSLSDGQSGAFARFLVSKMPDLALYVRNENGDSSLATQDYSKGQIGEPGYDWALLDKAVTRVGKTTVSIFNNDRQKFPSNLQKDNFNQIVEAAKTIKSADLQALFTYSVLHLDISKGGTSSEKNYWQKDLKINPFVHNRASAQLLSIKDGKSDNAFDRITDSVLSIELDKKERRLVSEMFIKVVEYHGLVGQYARGEVTEHAFAGFTDWATSNYDDLGKVFTKLSPEKISVGEMVSKIYLLANIIDTASVRDNLYSDKLHVQFDLLSKTIASVIDTSKSDTKTTWQDVLNSRVENIKGKEQKREFLADRITRLRGGRDYEEVLGTFLELPDSVVDKFFDTTEHAEFWYVENATSDLSVDNQLKLLFLVSKIASGKGTGEFGNFDVNFAPLMNTLRPDGRADKVLTKIIDTSLYNLSWEKIMNFSSAADEVISEKGVKIVLGGENGMTGLEVQLTPEFRSAVNLVNTHYKENRVENAEYTEALQIIESAVHMKLDSWDRGIVDQQSYQEAMNSTMDRKIAPILPEVSEMMKKKESLVILGIASGTGGVEIGIAQKMRRSDTVIATDLSRVMVENMKRYSRVNLAQRYLEPEKQIARFLVIESDATQLTSEKIGFDNVDLITASSFDHEADSYIDKTAEHGQTLRNIYKNAFNLLKEPGQKFIDRDFMQDDNPNKKQKLLVGRPKDGDIAPVDFLRDFTKTFRLFTKSEIAEIESLPEMIKSGDIVELSKSLLMEIVAHYSWMKKGGSLKEKNERYGRADEAGAIQFAKEISDEIGIKIQTKVIKEDPGYERYISGEFDVLDQSGQSGRVPMYMASIVMERA